MGTLFSLKIPSHKRDITTCMSKYNLKIIWPCLIVNSLSEFQENILIHYHTMLHFDTPKIYSFGLIEWCFTLLSTLFQSYHSDSSHYSFLSWVSPVLGWALKSLAQGHSHEKNQRIQCGSNPGTLNYESNTLPLSHAGPYL